MKISKRVGRMALDAVGTAPSGIGPYWPDALNDALLDLGWECDGAVAHKFEGELTTGGPHTDTLLCLIAAIAGVKP